MIDRCGRNIDYLRISVTDRCNLRCIYCMPEEGVQHVERSLILQEEEILRICRVMAELGIRKIKLTGGEPLVRPRMPLLVEKLKNMPGIEKVTLTTNGVLLKEQMRDFAQAGLDGLNISLDTLDPGMYAQIARRDALASAVEGLEAAIACPGLKVKVNCVLLPGINESQWIKIAELAKDRPVDVRFIEMMPVGLGKKFQTGFQEEVLKRLRSAFGREQTASGHFGNGPAKYVQFEGFAGKIGFISALSHKFCSECNRIRLTAEGFLKPCLQYAAGEDLRKLVRAEVSEEELIQAVERAIYYKPACHHFEEKDSLDFEQKDMFEIGG